VVPELTAEALLAAAEWTDTMVGETEVCAASDKMILRFLDVLVERDRPFAGAGGVAELVGQRAALLELGAHYIAFKHLVWMYYLARRFLYADLVATLGADDERAAGARTLLDEPCEPPDFYVVGPDAMARVSLEQRGAWFCALAMPLVPFAPGGTDAPQAARALELAATMASDPDARDAAAEIARVTGATPEISAAIARALAQYARLDAIFGDAVACTESGFRTAYGRPPLDSPHAAVDAAVRDRLLPSSPRAYLALFAPAWMAANARP
jgi:hypothetical protein